MVKDGIEGICRPTQTVTDAGEVADASACPKGEVACTAALAQELDCIIGRCIIHATATPASPDSSAQLEQVPAAKSSAKPEPQATSPLTAGARVFQTNGEDPSKTEAEIVEALVTLHRHGADCAVGILHKDCTLEVLMQSFGIS